MTTKLIDFALNNRFLVLLAVVCVLFAGTVGLVMNVLV